MRVRLCPPSHTLAPPAFPSRCLGHRPIYTAVAAPTTVAIFMPSPLPPQPLAPEPYRATHPAHRAAPMRHRRFQGRRNASWRHAEGLGRCPALQRGAERVCSPLLGSKAPSSSVVYFFLLYLVLLNTNTMIYILCIKRGRAGASVLAVGGDEPSRARRWARIFVGCRGSKCGRTVPASWLRVSKRALVIAGAAHAKDLHNFIFYCYIHVILVKTNPMIYNMLYKLCS